MKLRIFISSVQKEFVEERRMLGYYLAQGIQSSGKRRRNPAKGRGIWLAHE